MRKNEVKQIKNLFTKNFNMYLEVVDEQKLFLKKLEGVIDPEKKKKNNRKTFYQSI